MFVAVAFAVLFQLIPVFFSRRVWLPSTQLRTSTPSQQRGGDDVERLRAVANLLFAHTSASAFDQRRRLPSMCRHSSQLRRCPEIGMLKKVYDVAIVGGGPVGVNAAIKASSLGKKTILIDGTPPKQWQFTGPTGLFSKALRDSAQRIDVKVLRGMEIGDVAIWAQVNEFIQTIMGKSGRDNAAAMSRARVPALRGRARLANVEEDLCTVNITFQNPSKSGGENILCRKVLLATGSQAVRLPCLGCLYEPQPPYTLRVFDSDSIKQLSFLPRSVAIVGGGIIAIEFARIFAELSARVTMIIRSRDIPHSLERVGIDNEIGLELQRDLMRAGVRLLFETEVESAEYVGDNKSKSKQKPGEQVREQISIKMKKQDGNTMSLSADMLFTATGRGAVSKDIGLIEIAGEDALAQNGDVVIGDDLQTLAPGVYAAGDLIGSPQLASTGIAQAEAAVLSMFNSENEGGFSPQQLLSDPTRFPVGVWTIPEVAFVGLTTVMAEERGLVVVEGKANYADTIRGHVHGQKDDRGGKRMLKLVVERAPPYVIVGVHIFGDDACELIAYGTTLVQDRKTLSDVLALINTAVTYHELFRLAASDALEVIERLEWRRVYDIAIGSDSPGLRVSSELAKDRLLDAGANAVHAERIASLFERRRYRAMDDFVNFAVRQDSPVGLFPAAQE